MVTHVLLLDSCIYWLQVHQLPLEVRLSHRRWLRFSKASFISSYPMTRAFLASACNDQRVSDMRLTVGRLLLDSWFIRTFLRCVEAEIKKYRSWRNIKNPMTNVQQPTALWPTRFSECAAQGTYSARLHCCRIVAAYHYIFHSYCSHYRTTGHGNQQ